MKKFLKTCGVITLMTLSTMTFSGCGGAVKSVGKTIYKGGKEIAMEVAEDKAVDLVTNAVTGNKNSQKPSSNKGNSSLPTQSSVKRGATMAVVGGAATAAVSEMQPNVPTGKNWIKDESNQIYLWNPEPAEDETIEWNGGYVKEDGVKYANGEGILKWYRGKKLIQTDEGNFNHGRHNGKFKHTLASGNVVYTNWDNGREIIQNHPEGGYYVGSYNVSKMKAYVLPETVQMSRDRKSFTAKVRATDDRDKVVYLDYKLWHDGHDLKFSNSQGFSGTIGANTPVESQMWEVVQNNF